MGPSFDSSQLGDYQSRDSAGRDINLGADANLLVNVLRDELADSAQYRRLDMATREVRQAKLDAELASIAAELRMQRWVIIIGLIAIAVILAVR